MQFKPDKLASLLVFYWNQFVIKTAVILTFVSTFALTERYVDVRVIILLERKITLQNLFTPPNHINPGAGK